MKKSVMPTTIAICCRLPGGLDPMTAGEWVRVARTARLDVSWTVAPKDLEATAPLLGELGEGASLAVDVPAEWCSSAATQSLDRRRLAAVRQAAPSLDAIVVRGGSGERVAPMRPDILVDHGIRIAAVKQPDRGNVRRSRRPAPSGWACRCPTWGLWEVGISPKEPRGTLARLLPFSAGPALPAGSLTVLQTGFTGDKSKREARQEFDRIVHWVARRLAARPHDTVVVTLSQLASILARGTSGTGPRSVLAA